MALARSVRRLVSAACLALPLGAAAPAAAAGTDSLSQFNSTPFPSSQTITGASWTTDRYGPPPNQFGDILSTSSVDAGSMYTLINDGGVGTQQPARWRNSVAQVTGSPGNLTFTNIGDPGPAKTYDDVNNDENQLTGVLGSYYANGFTAVGGTFYATQVSNYDWNNNAPFTGLAGIAYSTDQGQTWHSPMKPFPGPTGNLNFVQYGDNAAAPDGYVYAIATEREFNASTLILGRARADAADITDPSRWQWAAGSGWSSSISGAQPILTWDNHITYPRMSYDAGLHRYLLTFTYSYTDTPPGVWTDGSQLVVLESPSPNGPFSFVATQPDFGPSNGYDPAFPVNWTSSSGTDLWMIWAANFDGCSSGLDCSGAYGFNYRQLHLTLAGQSKKPGPPSYQPHRRPARRQRVRLYAAPAPPARVRHIADDTPEEA